jgi:hypothetical protein
MAGPVNPKEGFKYTLPTQNVDGSPLARDKIAKFQIGLSQTPVAAGGDYGLIKDDVQLEPGADQVSPISLIAGLAHGQWYAAARTVSSEGKVSVWSTAVPFVLEAVAPNPPSGFAVS